jgi:8-oxo-dGTP pyrophosphatase MutT (NUDIX family)
MISLNEYEDFKSMFSAVGCYVEHDNKILVLKRHSDKPQGETWCLPSGKIGDQENAVEATLRELFEETGIAATPGQLVYGVKAFVRYDTYDFIFHTFSLPLEFLPEIKLDPSEHSEYLWETKENILKLPLIPDFAEQMELHYKAKQK